MLRWATRKPTFRRSVQGGKQGFTHAKFSTTIRDRKFDGIEAMRVSVVGTSGSGKTTFARRLADALDVPHIELDAINWQANWQGLNERDPDEFRRRVSQAVLSDVWVACGNYSTARPLVLSRATHMVWLDYPKPVVMRRVIQRSLVRAIGKKEPWPGTGNRETFARWLDPEHPIRWAWSTYARKRERCLSELNDPTLAHIQKVRLANPNEAWPLIVHLRSHPPQTT